MGKQNYFVCPRCGSIHDHDPKSTSFWGQQEQIQDFYNTLGKHLLKKSDNQADSKEKLTNKKRGRNYV